MNALDNPILEQIRRVQAGDKEECGRIIEENSALIWSIVRRFYGRGTDLEDLYQLGCIGMMKAVYGFDASFNTMFSTYAVPKISGEIRRFLRDDGIIKVSRATKASAYKISKARHKLSALLEREPTLSELSEETGLSAEEIAVCENAGSVTQSLQQETGEGGLTVESFLGTENCEEEILDRVLLSEAVSALPETEQQIVKLRFFKSLTQDQTARLLNISQVQVSRLERKAIARLRHKIG